jgi:hypothetical protein
MVGDVKEEGVSGAGTALFLPRWFVAIDESCCKKGGECLGWVAAFLEAAIELFKVVETVVRAGGQLVDMAYHTIDEAG